MGLWIRLDNPDDLETRHCQTMPERGEWICPPEAIRIVREHNERKAREEQGISITLSKWTHHPDGTHSIEPVSLEELAEPGHDPTGEGSA